MLSDLGLAKVVVGKVVAPAQTPLRPSPKRGCCAISVTVRTFHGLPPFSPTSLIRLSVSFHLYSWRDEGKTVEG